MTTLSSIVGVCSWILHYFKLEAHGALMGSLEFCSLDYGLVMVLSCLCLLDVIVDAMDEKMFNEPLIGK